MHAPVFQDRREKSLPSMLRRIVGSVVRVCGSVFGVLLLGMAGCQRSLLYFPRKGPAARLTEEAVGAGLSPWRDAEGRWIGWRSSSTHADVRRALVLHGNGGCAVDRAYFVHALAARPGGTAWETAILEYPGYGARAGKPSEKAILVAATAALDALLAERPDPVLLIGESLGTGVACAVAAERSSGVAGLLLVTPFTSFVDVGAHHYPWLPVRWLLRDRYDAAAALKRYEGPVVFLLAGRDEVVPSRLGKALHDGYSGPKRLFVQPASTHNTVNLTPGATWWREAVAFLFPHD